MLPHAHAIAPNATIARLFFLLLDTNNAVVTGAVAADFTSIGRASVTNQVASITTPITPLSDGANPQAILSAGTVIEHGQGVYSVDAPGGPFAVDSLQAVPVHSIGTHQAHAYVHPLVDLANAPTAADNATATRDELAPELAYLDEAVSAPKTLTIAYDAAKTASQFDAGSDAVIVGVNNDKTGYGLTSGERSTLAGVLDLAIINQADGANLIGALADAIAADWIASDASPLAIIAALKSDSTYTTLITDAAAGKTAAELVRDRLTTDRAAKLDRDLAHALDAAIYKAAVPTVEQIDTQLTGSHGAGSWSGGGGGSSLSGPNNVTITVTDSDTEEAIELATVRMFRSGSTGSQTTDESGAAEFAVASATWKILIHAAGYESRVISGVAIAGDAALDYALTPILITASETAGLSVVYTTIKINGRAIEGATLEAQLRNQNSAANGTLLSDAIDTATTDEDGYVELELVQVDQFTDGDGVYAIKAKHGDRTIWSIEATIPAQDSVNVEDLRS